MFVLILGWRDKLSSKKTAKANAVSILRMLKALLHYAVFCELVSQRIARQVALQDKLHKTLHSVTASLHCKIKSGEGGPANKKNTKGSEEIAFFVSTE